MAEQNLLALAGWDDATDQDYINEFGLDPKGDINQQMFDRVEILNYEGYLRKGIPDGKARSLSKERKAKAISAAKKAGAIK